MFDRVWTPRAAAVVAIALAADLDGDVTLGFRGMMTPVTGRSDVDALTANAAYLPIAHRQLLESQCENCED